MTPLIIGQESQVGACIINRLQGECITTSRRYTGQTGRVWQLDLADTERVSEVVKEVLNRWEVKHIYIVGAATNVDWCESHLQYAYRVNVEATRIIGELAAKHRAKVAFFSTDYVFDGTSGRYTEEDRPNPLCVYGMSKLMGEQALLDHCQESVIIRTTGVYGYDHDQRNFMYRVFKSASSGKLVSLPNDQMSTPVLNTDLAEASIAVMDSDFHGIVNIVGDEYLSRHEFGCQLYEALGFDTSLIYGASTNNLLQSANRPLLAGLNNRLFRSLHQDFAFQRIGDLRQRVRQWYEAFLAA